MKLIFKAKLLSLNFLRFMPVRLSGRGTVGVSSDYQSDRHCESKYGFAKNVSLDGDAS